MSREKPLAGPINPTTQPREHGVFLSGQPVDLIELALLGIDDRFAMILELHGQRRVDGPLSMVLVLSRAIIHAHSHLPCSSGYIAP